MNLQNLHVGQTFKNYPALCREVGVEPKNEGNSKKAQVNDLRRFFEWEKTGNGHELVITKVFEVEKEKPLRADDIYSADVLTCLQWDCQECDKTSASPWLQTHPWERIYSLPKILSLCGFVAGCWRGDSEKTVESLVEACKNGAISASKQRAKFLLFEFNTHVKQYCATAIDRSLNRLSRNGYLTDFTKVLLVKDHGTMREATSSEEKVCSAINEEVKRDLGISFINLYNNKRFYFEYNKRLREATGLGGSLYARKTILKRPYAEVGKQQYDEARRRINGRVVSELQNLAHTDMWKSAEKEYELMLESADDDMQELLDLFDYGPEYFYRNASGGIEDEELFTREGLVGWFVCIGGKEDYVRHTRLLDERTKSQQ